METNGFELSSTTPSVLPVQIHSTASGCSSLLREWILKIRRNRRMLVGCRSIGFGFQLEVVGSAFFVEEPNWRVDGIWMREGRGGETGNL